MQLLRGTGSALKFRLSVVATGLYISFPKTGSMLGARSTDFYLNLPITPFFKNKSTKILEYTPILFLSIYKPFPTL